MTSSTTDAPPTPLTRPTAPDLRVRVRLPVEAWVAVAAVAAYAAGLAAGLPVSRPDTRSLVFIQQHYFSPLFAACALQLLVLVASGRRDRHRPLLTLRLLGFLALSVFVHFTLKAWVPLVNPATYDASYQAVDEALAPVLAGMTAARMALADAVPVNVDLAYHTLFVGMFFVSLSAHAVADTAAGQRRVVLGVCLILLVGGASYAVAPAVGPFVFREGVNEAATRTQAALLEQYRHVVATRTLPPGYFACPLAAMPSLHNAHGLFLTLAALRSRRRALRWLGVLYLPVLAWIVLGSVASAWHYLVDVPAGWALAVVCFVAARRLIPDRPALAAATGIEDTQAVGPARLPASPSRRRGRPSCRPRPPTASAARSSAARSPAPTAAGS